MTAASRRRSRRAGGWAETTAVLALRLCGYRILARGFTAGRGTGIGEVDVVARRGAVVAFVEVKLRPSHAQAAAAISPRQRGRIVRAARAFLAAHPDLAGCALRFDAMLVSPWRWPCHLRDAWQPEGGGPLDA